MGFASKWYNTSEYCTATSSDDDSWNPKKYSRPGDRYREGNIIYITPQVYFNKGAEVGKVDFSDRAKEYNRL